MFRERPEHGDVTSLTSMSLQKPGIASAGLMSNIPTIGMLTFTL